MFRWFVEWLQGTRSKGNRTDVHRVAAATAVDVAIDAGPIESVVEPDIEAKLPGDARHLMLAARLASVSALNARTGRRSRQASRRTVSSPVPTARLGSKRQRTTSGARRINSIAVRRQAQIIPFPTVAVQASRSGLRKAA